MEETAEISALKEFCNVMEGREKDAKVLVELLKTSKEIGYAAASKLFEENAGNQPGMARAEAELKALSLKLNQIRGKMIELGLDQLKEYKDLLRSASEAMEMAKPGPDGQPKKKKSHFFFRILGL